MRHRDLGSHARDPSLSPLCGVVSVISSFLLAVFTPPSAPLSGLPCPPVPSPGLAHICQVPQVLEPISVKS